MSSRFLGLTLVEPDPHRERGPRTPVDLRQGPLDRLDAIDCGARTREGSGKGVAGGREDVAVELGDRLIESLLMNPQGSRHGIGVGGPEAGGPDDIGELEGDRSRWDLRSLPVHFGNPS